MPIPAHQRQQRVAGGQVAAQCGRVLAELALRLGRARGLKLAVPAVELRAWRVSALISWVLARV